MNQIIVNLLHDIQVLDDLRAGLPYAFEVAAMEADRQEVGIYRERVIVGFLISKLGFHAIEFPESGNTVADVLVGGVPLQIKTVTGNGEVTAKWTADAVSAREVIENFEFESDLWLVRIWWEEKRRSVFYVPREVLQETAMETRDFLSSATGTNNRGVKLKRSFMESVEGDFRTTSVTVDWTWDSRHLWHPADIQHPLRRYTEYWDSRGTKPLQ